MYVTPRTLLGIIRLSQALARLNFRNTITMSDVDESIHLMDFSMMTLSQKSGSKKEISAQVREQKSKELID